MGKITAKQQLFVDEYLVDLNATQAALRAGYSSKTAYSVGHEILKKPEIEQLIKERMNDRSKRVKVDADYVLNRLSEIDQMDAMDIFDEHGSLLPIREWPKVWRQYISGMDVAEMFEGSGDERRAIGVLRKIKWPDKLKNLELLGKHVDIQAWKDRVEHDASDRLAEVIMQARKRERSND